MSSSPLPELAELARQRSDDAGRQCQHQHHEHDAEQELPIGGAGDRVDLEIVEHNGADDRTAESAEAAEHGHEHDLAGERPVQNIGRDQPVERHPENAGETGEAAGHQKRHPAIAPDWNAQELGARLVVADRLQRLAEGRMHDHPHEHGANAEQEQHVIVIRLHERLVRVAALEIDQAAKQCQIREGHAQAVGAAGHPEELVGQGPQHLRQRQRQDAEEDARVAHADVAERADIRPVIRSPTRM